MLDPSLLVAGTAASLLTVEGLWTVVRMKEPARQIHDVDMAPGQEQESEKICVVFPCYKDVVDLGKWLAWGDSLTRFVIVEDIHNGNFSKDRRVAILKRDNRKAFKAGAINEALDHISKLSMGDPNYFDHILFFDADHVPIEPLKKVRRELRNLSPGSVAQFFWYDGWPRKRAIDWLTFSTRLYSNYNVYNRMNGFTNLTGSAMAVPFPMILRGLRFPDSVTEDYALSLALEEAGLKVQVIPLVVSFGKSPKNFMEFVRQQERWAEGTIRDAIDNFHVMKHLNWRGRMDFLLHMNMYAQALWIVVSTLVLVLLGINLDYVAVVLMMVQLVAYFATMRQAPKRYWPYYFVLNYAMVPFQIYACMKGLVKTTGRFYRTPKFGGV